MSFVRASQFLSVFLLCSSALSGLTACSGVKFKDNGAASSSSSSLSDNGDGSVTGQILQPGDGVTTDPSTPVNVTPGQTPAAVLPKLTFVSPPCTRLSLCEVEFRLDKPYAQATQFNWQTNDSLYQTPHFPLYGQAGVHYVSTSGHTVFQPGETSKKVYVQNINANNYEIIIGIIISQCQYSNGYESCVKFFN